MIGIDICKISRFSEMENLDRFLEKYFTKKEIEYIEKSGNRFETIAGIFSAKEAFVKALGTGFGIVMPKQVEILHFDNRKPFINFLQKDIFLKNIDLSISHDGDFAISVVNLEFNKNFFVDYSYKNLLPKRDEFGHKGTFGKVGIIGGSKGMTGSVYLNANASLRMGSGLVYNIIPNSISNILEMKSIENIIIPIEDNGRGFFVKENISDILKKIQDFDAISVGCGLGKREDNFLLVGEILKNFKKPIVFDADSIMYLKNFKDILKNRENVILTPHIKEFSLFSEVSMEDILKDRIGFLEKNYSDFKCTILLKGKNTIVFSNGNYIVNKTGSNAMATAGSGDVLTGIILSLLGQSLGTFNSGKLGAYLHGLSGDIASEKLTEYSVIASDLIKFLPNAIKMLRGN